MALTKTFFIDSCDHYDQDDYIYVKWTNQAFAKSTPNGRNGRGINLTQGGGYVAKTLTHQSEWVVGWAINIQAGTGTGASSIYNLNSTNSGICGLTLFSDWTLGLYSGNNLIAASAFSLHPHTWYYIELKILLSFGGSGGANVSTQMTCRVNGAIVANGGPTDSGVPISTLIIQSATANYHLFSCPNILGNTLIDDIYIYPLDAGGYYTDFLGDLKILVVFPNGDVLTQWTPSVGTQHFPLVNSQFAENSPGFIFTNTPSDADNFTWQPIPAFVGQIILVHYGALAKKDDEGTRQFQLTVGAGGGETSNTISPLVNPGDTYVYYFFGMDVDPGTSSQWTQSGFNGTDFGIKEII